MFDQAETADQVIKNGINVTEFEKILEAVNEEPGLAQFQFRSANSWDEGGYNITTIKGFYGAGEEHGESDRHFELDADEPPVLLGKDQAPNPVEYILHALAGCLTSTIIYKAALKGISIESIESSFEGDLDARKFLELGGDGRCGYENIRASFRVKADAPAEEIRGLAEFSPVLDVLRNGTQISLQVEEA